MHFRHLASAGRDLSALRLESSDEAGIPGQVALSRYDEDGIVASVDGKTRAVLDEIADAMLALRSLMAQLPDHHGVGRNDQHTPLFIGPNEIEDLPVRNDGIAFERPRRMIDVCDRCHRGSQDKCGHERSPPATAIP